MRTLVEAKRLREFAIMTRTQGTEMRLVAALVEDGNAVLRHTAAVATARGLRNFAGKLREELGHRPGPGLTPGEIARRATALKAAA